MAKLSDLTQHIECYVDMSRSPPQQAASLDEITSFVNNGLVTIETLVKEMEMYLTTTDNVIRARGTLLIGELFTNLRSKPLDKATIHSLIGFFMDRLADWRALRGALVGCLALMRRENNAGMITGTDAKAVAQSYLQNIQVQSLGQHDRKLCFELLACLLESYHNEVASMGEELICGTFEAVDGEKDPQCLLQTFRIIEALVQLFPDPSGPLANYCADLFEILGCYFPIHFTHPTGEDADVKRDDLSRALMSAFSSTPLFEPFSIPLLLEKLSSTLPLAKVDSLKYLIYCAPKYGPDRMAKHARAIWISLKDTMSSSLEDPIKPITSEPHGLGFQENEIVTEALMLLQVIIGQNDSLFLSLIMGDEDIITMISTITSYANYNDISLQGKQRLHVVGRILYITAGVSVASCNRVFESFFYPLMEALGLSETNLSGNICNENLNVGALYLFVELLAALRYIMDSRELEPNSVLAHGGCFFMLLRFSVRLVNALCWALERSRSEASEEMSFYFTVKGLQILATLPEDIFPISKITYEKILTTVVSVVLLNHNQRMLWKVALKALVQIGSDAYRYDESQKALSYMEIIVEKTVSSVLLDDFSLPLPLKMEALSEIGTSGQNHMLRIIQGLEEAIFATLSDVYVQGNVRAAELAAQLLECYSNKFIPWIHEIGLDKVLLQFANNIWSRSESWKTSEIHVHEKGFLAALMTAMKLAVRSCSVESQNKIVEKAYDVLSSFTFLQFKKSVSSIPTKLEGLQLRHQIEKFSHGDELILVLFASVIIAVHPKTDIPNIKEILHLFMTTLLEGYVPSAQALGSMINKFSSKCNGPEISSNFTLEEAMGIIFETKWLNSHGNGIPRYSGVDNNGEMGLTDFGLGFVDNRQIQVHAIVGLAWIGKGLLLRGHEKVRDVVMILLECLLSDDSFSTSKLKQEFFKSDSERDLHHSVMKSAADAFHILMGDSEVCLNRKFHAITRPLYKQKFFSTVMPILLSLITKSDASFSRCMLYRASAHVISNAPLIAVMNEAKKLVPVILEGLTALGEEMMDKENLYSLLLVLSGILTDRNGQDATIENAHIVINCLTRLIAYPHMLLVRETAIQCLVAMSQLPHARIYPLGTQVLQAISKALDDPKRAVRQEAGKCRQAWVSIAPRSLHS